MLCNVTASKAYFTSESFLSNEAFESILTWLLDSTRDSIAVLTCRHYLRQSAGPEDGSPEC